MPVSQAQLRVWSRRMARPRFKALNILQPRWDHLQTQANQDNATALNGPWGMPPGMKLEDALHLGFQNFSSFPELPSHPKNDSFCSFIDKHDFDVFGLAETNATWSVLPASAHFKERIRNTWSKTHSSLAHNRMTPTRAPASTKGQSAFHQHGGVASLSTSQAAHRVSGSGRDPTGLGQ